MKDWRGNTVYPGCTILYSTKQSGSIYQNIAQVKAVHNIDGKWSAHVFTTHGTNPHQENYPREMWVSSKTITVIELPDG